MKSCKLKGDVICLLVHKITEEKNPVPFEKNPPSFEEKEPPFENSWPRNFYFRFCLMTNVSLYIVNRTF